MENEETGLLKKAIGLMETMSGTPVEERCKDEDIYDIFGKYVATELRSIQSEQDLRWAKLHIQQIIYDAQSNASIGTIGQSRFHGSRPSSQEFDFHHYTSLHDSISRGSSESSFS